MSHPKNARKRRLNAFTYSIQKKTPNDTRSPHTASIPPNHTLRKHFPRPTQHRHSPPDNAPFANTQLEFAFELPLPVLRFDWEGAECVGCLGRRR